MMNHVKQFLNKEQIIGNVLSTTNYNFFRENRLNREVKDSKLNRMTDSLKEYGQITPVISNKTGYVIDGHHRLSGCVELSIPVFYITIDVTDEQAEELIQEINDIQKSWSIQDHIEYYSKKGNKHYQKSIELGKKYGIRPGIIANSLGRKGVATKDVKSGKLILRDEKILERFLEFHNKFYFMPNKKQAYFIQALFEVWAISTTDEERLFKTIAKNKELFEFSIPKKAFIMRMKEEYNKGLRKESNKL